MKSKKVTLDQVRGSWYKLQKARRFLIKADREYKEQYAEFNLLTNRASKDVLATFVRKGDLHE